MFVFVESVRRGWSCVDVGEGKRGDRGFPYRKRREEKSALTLKVGSKDVEVW